MSQALRGSLLAVILFTSGCASKWVHKPEIDSVHSLAIASVFANRDVGGDRGSKAKDNGSALRKVIGTESDTDPRIRQVAYAGRRFAAQFAKLGWKVIPNEKVAQSPSYKKLATVETGSETLNKVVSFLGRAAQKDYVTLPGIQAIDLAEKNGGNGNVGKLKDLCEELHVDAVALVQLHMTFDESILTIVGNRSVRPMAQTRVDILTKTGDFAVRTADIQSSKAFEANESVWINNGKMELNDKAEKVYRQAIDKSIDDLITRVQTEMRAKG